MWNGERSGKTPGALSDIAWALGTEKPRSKGTHSDEPTGMALISNVGVHTKESQRTVETVNWKAVKKDFEGIWWFQKVKVKKDTEFQKINLEI